MYVFMHALLRTIINTILLYLVLKAKLRKSHPKLEGRKTQIHFCQIVWHEEKINSANIYDSRTRQCQSQQLFTKLRKNHFSFQETIYKENCIPFFIRRIKQKKKEKII